MQIFNEGIYFEGCLIYVFTGGLFGFVTISTLAFMTVEKYLVVRNPLLSLKITRPMILMCILFIYLYSSLWIVVKYFAGNHNVVVKINHFTCSFDYVKRDFQSRLLLLINFICGFFIPFLIIIVFNYLLMKSLKSRTNNLIYQLAITYRLSIDYNIDYRHNKGSSFESKSYASLLGDPQYLRSSTSRISSSFHRRSTSSMRTNLNSELFKNTDYFIKREVKVIRGILLNFGTFCIVWIPYVIVIIMAQTADQKSLTKYVTPMSTALLRSHCKNLFFLTLLYMITNSEFRRRSKGFLGRI